MRVCVLKNYRVMLVFLSLLALSLLVLSVLWLLLAAILPEYSPFTPIRFFWLWWVVDAIGYGIAIAALIIAGANSHDIRAGINAKHKAIIATRLKVPNPSISATKKIINNADDITAVAVVIIDDLNS